MADRNRRYVAATVPDDGQAQVSWPGSGEDWSLKRLYALRAPGARTTSSEVGIYR